MGVMYAVLIDITPGFFSRMAGPYITNNSVFSLWMLAPIVGAISVVLLTDEKISQIGVERISDHWRKRFTHINKPNTEIFVFESHFSFVDNTACCINSIARLCFLF